MYFREVILKLSNNNIPINKLYFNNLKIYDHDNNEMEFIESNMYSLEQSLLTLRGHAKWHDKDNNEIYVLFESNLPVDDTIKDYFNKPATREPIGLTDNGDLYIDETVEMPKIKNTPFIFTGETPLLSPVNAENKNDYYIRLVFINDSKAIKAIGFSAKSEYVYTPYVEYALKDINDKIVKSEILVDVDDINKLNNEYLINYKKTSDELE